MDIIERELKSNRVFICPVGDIQYGNFACSVSYVRRYLEWTYDMAQRLNAELLYIGTGDYVDLMSPSNRQRYQASGLYSSTTRAIEERTAVPIMHEAMELIGPYMNNRTVCLTEGHHWFKFDEPVDGYYSTDQWLAAMIGAEFVKRAVIVKFRFPSGRVFRFHACHGEGNGSTETYGINKLSRQSRSWEGVDAFAMGHTHKAGVAALVRVYEENGELVSRQIPLITCGGFLKSYLVGEVNYPEEKQLWSLALSATGLFLEETGEENSELLISPMLLL